MLFDSVLRYGSKLNPCCPNHSKKTRHLTHKRLASTCCLGPLLLITLGFSGVWIGNLTVLEPYRPVFIAIALMALLLAWRHIWHPVTACIPGAVCAVPEVNRAYRLLFDVIAVLVLIALAFPYLSSLFY